MKIQVLAAVTSCIVLVACSTTDPSASGSTLASSNTPDAMATGTENAESAEVSSAKNEEALDPNRKVCKPVESSAAGLPEAESVEPLLNGKRSKMPRKTASDVGYAIRLEVIKSGVISRITHLE